MSLAKEILAFLNMPKTLNQLTKENKNVMSKVQELQAAFEEMKQTLAEEASELWDKFDELQAQIDARVDPSSLEPIIAEIRGTISNVEALSEGRPVAPAPTGGTETGGTETGGTETGGTETGEDFPTETGGTETGEDFPTETVQEPEVGEPTTTEGFGGDGSDEEPTF